MVKNYFKIAWRNLLKNKGLFSINIFGLALGIASCLIIILFVTDEMSYDRYNEKADQIVRVVLKGNFNGEVVNEAIVMTPVAETMMEEFPEVQSATRLKKINKPKVTFNNTTYRNGTFAYVDPNFFEVFTLPIIKGNNTTPLNEPNTIVLIQEEATKYFGVQDPIGKVLDIDDLQFKVTAIIEKIPNNSHFHFDMLASMVGYKEAKKTSWTHGDYHTYLILKEGYNYKDLESKLPPFIEKYMGPEMKQEIGMSFNEFTKDNQIGLFLQPLTDIHLKSDFTSASTLEQGGDIKVVYIFSAIALFMLIIACINFINLATASATKRAKEVGIRKVLGSKRKQLISQFLTESFMASIMAMVLALIFVAIVLPLFNNLSGKELAITYLFSPKILLVLISLLIGISFLAGFYPAFYIASFKPILALKSKFSRSGKSEDIRSGLVVFQFVVSVGLILAVIIVDQQMSFIKNKDIGYDKEQLLVLRESYFLGNNKAAFKNKILKDPRVTQVTTAAFTPAGTSDKYVSGIFINQQFNRRVNVYNVDEQYIPTMGMTLVKGRNFSKEFGTDSLNIIINETAAMKLGFGDVPLGKTLTRDTNNGKQNLRVIGVVKDFHFQSLHKKIEPLIMLNNPYGGLIVKAKIKDMSGLIESISTLWNSFDIGEPFNYSLLDESYNTTYLKEQKLGTILRSFALLTIFVACLGLFGLVTFTTEQRFKEIGIRKVLGSSILQIVTLLSKDFIKLVLVSFVIAFPLGYYLMNKWLEDFAYRIEIHWSTFVMSGLITIIIAFITISFRSINAAITNPIKSLKTE